MKRARRHKWSPAGTGALSVGRVSGCGPTGRSHKWSPAGTGSLSVGRVSGCGPTGRSHKWSPAGTGALSVGRVSGCGPTGRSWRAFLVAVLLVATTVSAAEEKGPPSEVPADLLVSDIRLGPFYVKPSFSIDGLGVDSNVLLSDSNPERDVTAAFTPAVRLALPAGDNVFSLSQSVSYVYFRDFATERGWNSDTRARLELLLGGFRLNLQETFRRTRERLDFEIFTRPRRIESRFDGSLSTDHDAGVYFEGAFSYNLIRFDSEAVFGQAVLSRALDRAEVRGGLAAVLGASEVARFVAGVDFQREDFRFGESRDRDAGGYFAFGGLRFEGEGPIAGDLRVGYQLFDVRREDHPDSRALGVRSRLSFELGGSSSLLLEVESGPEHSSFSDNLFYTATRVRSTLRIPVAEVAAIELGPLFVRGRYPVAGTDDGGPGVKRADDVTWLEGRVVVPLGDVIAIELGVFYRHLSSNVPGVGYDGTVFSTGLRYGR